MYLYLWTWTILPWTTREESHGGRRASRMVRISSRPFPTYHWQWIWMTAEILTCALAAYRAKQSNCRTFVNISLMILNNNRSPDIDISCLLWLTDNTDGFFYKFIQIRHFKQGRNQWIQIVFIAVTIMLASAYAKTVTKPLNDLNLFRFFFGDLFVGTLENQRLPNRSDLGRAYFLL